MTAASAEHDFPAAGRITTAARSVRTVFVPEESDHQKGQELMEGKLILVVAALELELAGIRRTMKTTTVFRMGEARCAAGSIGEQACLLVHCGMGRQRAEGTLRLVFAEHQPFALLSLGFCGALAATLRPGDLVVCSPLRALHTMAPLVQAAPVDRMLRCDEGLVRQALLVSSPPPQGLTRWFKATPRVSPVEGE
jgi:hypothetical protein